MSALAPLRAQTWCTRAACLLSAYRSICIISHTIECAIECHFVSFGGLHIDVTASLGVEKRQRPNDNDATCYGSVGQASSETDSKIRSMVDCQLLPTYKVHGSLRIGSNRPFSNAARNMQGFCIRGVQNTQTTDHFHHQRMGN